MSSKNESYRNNLTERNNISDTNQFNEITSKIIKKYSSTLKREEIE